METVIKLNGINKIYRTDEVETQALENVNLEVRKGEFLSIMGPSGFGQSPRRTAQQDVRLRLPVVPPHPDAQRD